MATSPTSLRVRISADLADIRQGLGLLRGELAKVKTDAAKALPNSNGFVAGLRRARTELLAFAGVYLSLRSVSVFAGLSDEATQLRGRLRAARGDYEAILQLAQETRTGLASTVDLYARLERSTRSQGLNQDRLLAVTRAVNQAIKLSFADQGTADAAITQLGQGLAAGTLRGEELNSVLEGTPRLAEAIAAGLGKPVGQLRALAKEGKLTSTEVIRALENQAGALEKEYGAVPVTIGDALTQVRNSFLDFIGDQNEATGASQAFAKILQQIAQDLPKFFGPLLQVMVALAGNIGDVSESADGLSDAAGRAGKQTEFMAGAGQFLANVLRVVAAGAIIVKNVVEAVTVVLAALADMAFTTATALSTSLGGAFGALAGSFEVLKADGPLAAMKAYRGAIGGIASDLATLPARLKGKARIAAETVSSEWGDATGGISALFDNVAANASKSAQATAAAAVGAAGAAEGASSKTGRAIAASNALLRDSIDRALKELDRLYSENEIGAQQYFATRRQLQESAIDAEIEQARAELAVTSDLAQRRRIEEDLIKLGRDRAEVAIETAREEQKANDALLDQLGQIRAQELELDGKMGEAARLRLEAEYLELFKKLEAASDETGKTRVRNLIERLVSKAQLDQLKSQGDQIGAALQGSETSLSAQASAGLIGGLEAERQIEAARVKALRQYQALRQAALEYYNAQAPGTPEHAAALAGLQAIETSIANVIASQNVFRQQIEDLAVSSISNAFSDLVTGAQNFKDSFKQMVRSFAQGVAQMIAQALALRAVRATLGLFGGGAGASFAAAHGGGTVGALSMIRHNINPLVFGTVPRYHEGGQAGLTGLKNKEVAAILQEGETIRTKEQEAALARRMEAGQGQAGQVTTPIVAIGDQAVADAMASAAGERVVLTIVRNHWSGLSRGQS
jgi:tape measure domain-containing protein